MLSDPMHRSQQFQTERALEAINKLAYAIKLRSRLSILFQKGTRILYGSGYKS
ncbi:hypothetical protein BURPS305_1903 [Burkholderia pseudomallei 305]|nr:hypothetical protein BURPS305_1903 [Burkholderia pseudomallei 305]